MSGGANDSAAAAAAAAAAVGDLTISSRNGDNANRARSVDNAGNDCDCTDPDASTDSSAQAAPVAPRAPSRPSLKNINLVFIGHVDAGKSTLCGHLLYLTGGLDDRTLEKYEREAKSKGRESWKFAWALDLTEQERSKGKTTEYGVASFSTRTKHFTIIDAPGHKSYVPQMISGAGQADVGILVISARKGEFEAGYERGGQTREHAVLAKTAGVRQLVVAVNKMDEASVEWNEQRYNDIREKLTPFLKQVGYRPNSDIVWLPVSGFTGENLRERVSSATCSWFRGESLMGTLDALKPPQRLVDAPMRMAIVDKFKELGLCVVGKLEAGTVRVGDKLIVQPLRAQVTVTGLWTDSDEVQAAEPGDSVKIMLKGVEEDDLHAGFVLCSQEAASLVHATTQFEAQVMLLEHRAILTAGYKCIAHIHAATEEVVFERLLNEIDKKSGAVAKKHPRFVRPGSTFTARMSITQPVCVCPFREFAPLGRFMLRDEGTTIGAGVILKVRPSEKSADAPAAITKSSVGGGGGSSSTPSLS